MQLRLSRNCGLHNQAMRQVQDHADQEFGILVKVLEDGGEQALESTVVFFQTARTVLLNYCFEIYLLICLFFVFLFVCLLIFFSQTLASSINFARASS